MRTGTITKVFTITATPNVMKTFERFLAFMHHNGGHSATFGMTFDGDGWDFLEVSPSDEVEKYVRDAHRIGSCGPEFEIAYEDSYWATFGDHKRNRYKVKDGKAYRYNQETDTFTELK